MSPSKVTRILSCHLQRRHLPKFRIAIPVFISSPCPHAIFMSLSNVTLSVLFRFSSYPFQTLPLSVFVILFMASSFCEYFLFRHVLLPERVASVACGGNHTVALTQSGDNFWDQLRVLETQSQAPPRSMETLVLPF